jgi:hypothetical protein
MALTLLVALVLAPMINSSSAWAFAFQIVLVLTLMAAIIRGLFHSDGNYALHGFMLGGLIVIVTWFLPIPIAIIINILNIRRPFGDIMLISVLFLGTIPLIGAGVGWLIPRSSGKEEDSEG